MNILKELISIANSLDELKKYSEANQITKIAASIRKSSDNFGMDDREHISDFGDLEDTDMDEELPIEHEQSIILAADPYILNKISTELNMSYNPIEYPGEEEFVEFVVGEKILDNKFRTLIVEDIYFNPNNNRYYVVIRDKRPNNVHDPLKGPNSLWGVAKNLKDRFRILSFHENEIMPSG